MAHLVNLSQRIKAAQTIKKITHAMRLISMSNNLKLRSKKNDLATYSKEIKKLLQIVKSQVRSDIITQPKSNKELAIIISSEKGLCGNFNNALFNYFEKTQKNNCDLIIVGKEGLTFSKELNLHPIKIFPHFNSLNFKKIAIQLAEFINNNQDLYKSVIVYSNWPKSFFVQKQKHTVLVPFNNILNSNNLDNSSNIDIDYSEYMWPQNPDALLKILKSALIFLNITEICYDSLLAEQAARFISMDNATRNATNLINSMKLEYNKLRQAAITRELTELSGGSGTI